MPRPKCFCQSRLTMTRAVSGLSGEAIQCASAQAPARGAPVGPRDLGRRIAAGDHLHEPRLHLRAAALDIAADQEIRRRRLVAAGTLVQIAAGERRRNPALRAAHHLVALAQRREAMVAVGGDLGHRQRRRPLLLEAATCATSSLPGRELGRRHRRLDRPRGHVDRFEHLDRQQLLAGGPLALGFGGGLVDGVGEARLDQRQLEAVAMRLLDGGDFGAAGRRAWRRAPRWWPGTRRPAAAAPAAHSVST